MGTTSLEDAATLAFDQFICADAGCRMQGVQLGAPSNGDQSTAPSRHPCVRAVVPGISRRGRTSPPRVHRGRVLTSLCGPHPAIARTAATRAVRWLAKRWSEPLGSAARPRRAGEAFAHGVVLEMVKAGRSAASQVLLTMPAFCAAAIAATVGRYSSIFSAPTSDRSSCAQTVRRSVCGCSSR